jgi:hypothetical protein
VVVRVGAGAGLAAAAAGSGQVSGTLAAFALGVATPLVIEKLSSTIALTGTDTITHQIARPERTNTSPPAYLPTETAADPSADDTSGAPDAR